MVMATMGDPRAIVASFANPGGNITGVTTFSTELTAKRIELLKELVPKLSRDCVGSQHGQSGRSTRMGGDKDGRPVPRAPGRAS